MNRMVNSFVWMLAILIILMACVAIYSIYQNATSPTIAIKNDDWVCTKTESYTALMPMGKVIMPQTQSRCIEYKRVK